MPRTLIHVGMPRTASTLFQRKVFPLVDDFLFAGVERTQYSAPFQKMMYQDESLYDAKAFLEATADLRKGNSLLSNELFVGQSLFWCSGNRSRNFKRLQEAFPDAEIVLFLRNQEALLRSLYSIGIYAGYTSSPESFVRFPVRNLGSSSYYDTFSPCEHVEFYNFAPLVEALERCFKKVHVFLFEDFIENPDGFVDAFATSLQLRYTGKPEVESTMNRSLSTTQLAILRKLNRCKSLLESGSPGRRGYHRMLRFVEHSIQGNPFRFSDELSTALKEYFRSDNALYLERFPQIGISGNFEKWYL